MLFPKRKKSIVTLIVLPRFCMKKVLLIDDSFDIRENVSEILALSNYIVFKAANGQEGIDLAHRKNPDLILCDIMMPVVDGFGVFMELNKNLDTAGIPFVFLTAATELESRQTGLRLGADDYIIKPFNEQLLLSTIEARINRHRAAKERRKKEQLAYITELEELMHITSHKVRKPVCNILGLLKLLDMDDEMNAEKMREVLVYSKECALELDTFTRELTLFLEQSKARKDNGIY